MSDGPSKRARLVGKDFVYPTNAANLCMKILKSQKDCDVFFVVGPNQVRIGAHKLILRAKSPVFEAMFSERWETGSSEESHEIVLEDNEPSVFNTFLEYVYADVFKATVGEAVELLHFAQFYDIKTLVKPCEDLLAGQFQLDDIFKILTCAHKYGLSDLMTRVMGHLVIKFGQLANTPSLEKVDETMLIYLLKRADLFINESELFSVLLKWADKQIENSTQEPKPERKEMLMNIIPLIRFPTMTAKEFAEVVAPSKILPEETAINLFMYLNSSEKIRSEIGPRIPYDKTPRKGIVIDLYSERSGGPRNIRYPNAELIKCARAQDSLRFKFNWSKRAGTAPNILKPRIASLLLQRPNYEQLRFQNSSEVARMSLPIKVEIALCWSIFDMDGKQRIHITKTQCLTMRDEDETLEVVVEGWELLNDTSYQIWVTYMAELYVLPKILDVVSWSLRNERYDFLTTKTLRPEVVEENYSGVVTFSSLGMTGGCYGMDPIPMVSFETGDKTMSSGLHLLRSLRITFA